VKERFAIRAFHLRSASLEAKKDSTLFYPECFFLSPLFPSSKALLQAFRPLLKRSARFLPPFYFRTMPYALCSLPYLSNFLFSHLLTFLTSFFSNFPLPHSHFPLQDSPFRIPTSHFKIPPSAFRLPTSRFPLPHSAFPLP
jgi:hypothetical protein